MTSALNVRYGNRYPRQGKAAILCEGDVAGYEVDLLEKWSASAIGNVLLDVWPCGTKNALYGLSDAIGRSVPIFIIEDRDARSLAVADKECKEREKDRRKRNIQIGFWRCWRRHEIENYLIEPSVIIPVLASAFRIAESDVAARLDATITRSRVDQAAQHALAVFRSELPESHEFVQGLPRKDTRPRWDQGRREIVEPPAEEVEKKLREIVDASFQKFVQRSEAASPSGIMDVFHSQAKIWHAVTAQDATWRIDWSGKEILTNLCRWLAGEFGWPDSTGARQPLNWEELVANKRDTDMDRQIAWALQPLLCHSFLDLLDRKVDEELHAEWNEITEIIGRVVQ